MGLFGFGKEKRLTGRKNIQELFNKGSSFYLYPFKVIWLHAEDQKVLVSVSSRNFKKAVDRNRIKRLVREAYRLNRQKASPAKWFALVYTGKSVMPFKEIETKLIKVLSQLDKL